MALSPEQELQLLELEKEKRRRSSQSQAPTAPQAQSFFDRIRMPQSPVAVPGTIPSGLPQTPIGPGSKFPNPLNMEEPITRMTEDIAKSGIDPRIAAGIGTIYSLGAEQAPFAIPGMQAAKPVGKATTAAIKKGSKFITAPGMKRAGQLLGEAEEAAGIAVSPINEALPRARKALIETLKGWEPLAEASVKELRSLGGESLNIFRKQAGDILDFLNVAKMNKSPKQLLTKSEIALVSKIKDKVTQALSQEVPKVGQAIEDFATSARRKALLKTLGKVGGVVGGGAALLGIGSNIASKIGG